MSHDALPPTPPDRDDASTRAILDSLTDVVAVYDADWRYLHLNPAARALLANLGVDPDTVLGRVLWEVLPQPAAMEAAMREAAREGRSTDFEETLPGTDRWFETRLVPGARGTITSFSRDVTERRRALAAERAGADRARRLLAVTTALGEARTTEEVADAIFVHATAALGADAGSLALVRSAPGGELHFRVVRDRGFAEPVIEKYRQFPVRAGRPLSDALLTRAPRLIASRIDWRAQYPAVADEVVGMGFEAFAAIPIVSSGQVLAGLAVSFRQPLLFDEGMRTFMASIGEQCGLALERARAFEAEQAARAFASDLIDSLRDGFVAFDHEFHYTYVNAEAARLLQHPADRLIGRSVWDTFAELAHTDFGRAFRRVAETRVPETVEAYSPGVGAWFEARLYPSSQGLTVFFQDVTARRRRQDADHFLAEAGEMLAASLDHEATLRALTDAAVPRLADWAAIDLVDDPDDPTWPPRLERVAVLHRDPAKFELGLELTRRYPTDWEADAGMAAVVRDRRAMLLPDVTDAMLVAGARDPEHLALLRALGFTSIIVAPMLARDRVVGVLTLCTAESKRRYDGDDLTLAQEIARRAAHALENARLFRDAERARADAESANVAKAEFLSTMSHELRTPLNAIQGYTELMELGLRGEVSNAQREDLTRIRRNAKVLMSLVTDVLNFARIEAGEVEYAPTDVWIGAIVTDLEAVVAPQMRAKAIRFETPACDPRLWARADPDRAQQILTNLLSNAIKFTDAGGRVEVTCDAVLAIAGPAADQPSVDGDFVRVRVSDSGRGIPPDRLEAIFEPFVQVDRHLTHESQQGVGLGLAISRDLARAMGGELRVESAPGAGSTFSLLLPRAAYRGD